MTTATPQPVGFVEVWSDSETRLARQPVTAAPGQAVAHVDFTLPEDVPSLEYRFYVNGAVGMSLDRVELFSGTAIPPSAN